MPGIALTLQRSRACKQYYHLKKKNGILRATYIEGRAKQLTAEGKTKEAA